MATESPTPEDPRADLAKEIAVYLDDGWEAPYDAKRLLAAAHRLLSLPDTEGVASLRASGTPGESVEVMAAEIEAHAAQAVPASDVDLLRALVSGLSLKEYAVREGLRPSAASQRANRMRQHLGASSNEQAVLEAFRRGLLNEAFRP